MRIGELARCTGVTTRALRYYEQRGLLSSARLHNGYREYGPEAETRVRNIRFLLRAGLHTDDIRGFGTCLDTDLAHEAPCADELAQVEHRMLAVEGRIAELTDAHERLRAHLAQLRQDFDGEQANDMNSENMSPSAETA